MERKHYYAIGFLAIAVLVIATLAFADGEFGGADDAGGDAIGSLTDYTPWWDGIFGSYELPGETESLLFALQAALGAIIIGYFIGRYSKGA